ncbi:hypothetical protein C5167_021605, partial [Papaver somniferum]
MEALKPLNMVALADELAKSNTPCAGGASSLTELIVISGRSRASVHGVDIMGPARCSTTNEEFQNMEKDKFACVNRILTVKADMSHVSLRAASVADSWIHEVASSFLDRPLWLLVQ